VHIAICQRGRGLVIKRYDPIRHALVTLPVPEERISRFLSQVQTFVPGPAIALVALVDGASTARWYHHSESLSARDAGCVLAILHLAATALGLGSCLLGLQGVQLRVAVGGRVLQSAGTLVVGRNATEPKPARTTM